MELVMRFNFLVLFFIFFNIILTSSESFAQLFGRRGSGAKVGPSIGAMVLFANGKTGNTTDVLERSMIHTPIAIFAGFNLKKIRLGINYEYDLIGQSDDPASFANQNLGGKNTSAGLRVDYYNGKTAFGVVYRLSDKYTLDKATASGATSEYDGKSGLSLQFYTQIKKKFGIVVDYSMGEFKSATGNSDDIKWNRIGLGLVFSNFAGSSSGRGR